MTTDDEIIAECLVHGIDFHRLDACLSSHDNWGKMIHAFEYVTVLGIVLNVMKKSETSNKESE